MWEARKQGDRQGDHWNHILADTKVSHMTEHRFIKWGLEMQHVSVRWGFSSLPSCTCELLKVGRLSPIKPGTAPSYVGEAQGRGADAGLREGLRSLLGRFSSLKKSATAEKPGTSQTLSQYYLEERKEKTKE